MNSNLNIVNNNYNNLNEEIDLKAFLRFFVRNKKLISITSLLFFLVFAIYSFFAKKVYEGQFEIVLEKPQENQLSNLPVSPSLDSLVGIPNNSLKTEVGVLESQSILLPIFEKNILNKKKYSRKTFEQWRRENLDINLKKNTSILKISYKDNDKDLIKTVLNKISKKYQDYSGKSRRRRNQLSKKYLKDQINYFRDKSSKSFKDAQSFAIDQDLDILGTNNDSNNKFNENINSLEASTANIGIERIRVNAANKIRDIDKQIEKIKSLGDDINQLQYIGSTIPGLVKEGLPDSLKQLDENLVELRTKYTDKNLKIKLLLDKRELLIDLLVKRSLGYLEAERLVTEAIMEAAMRPKDILLKYKELIRVANRDESTLIDLENKLRIIELEDAKLDDPWELITIPTILDKPVAPSKKSISLFGLILGFLVGSLYSFYKEYKSEFVLEEENLKSILNTKILTRFVIQENIINQNKYEFPFNELIANKKSLSVLFTSNINSTFRNNFNEFLNKNLSASGKKTEILNLQETLISFKQDSNLILVTSLDKLKIEEVKNLKKRLEYLKINSVIIFLF